MVAENPTRRKVTATEGAKRLKCSPRTVQRIAAEPREEFLKRSRSRGEKALALKQSGLTYRQIGEQLGCSARAAESLVHRARERQAASAPAQSRWETRTGGTNDEGPAELPGQLTIDEQLAG